MNNDTLQIIVPAFIIGLLFAAYVGYVAGYGKGHTLGVKSGMDWIDTSDETTRLKRSLAFYKDRVNLLEEYQSTMRDPERVLVCDILANAQLLPDPQGKRYGFNSHV